jgi:hypothetical protein
MFLFSKRLLDPVGPIVVAKTSTIAKQLSGLPSIKRLLIVVVVVVVVASSFI